MITDLFVYNGGMNRERNIFRRFPVILLIFFLFVQRYFPRLFSNRTLVIEITIRFLLGSLAFFFTYLIDGRRVFSYFGNGTMYCVRRLFIMIVPSIWMSVLSISSFVMGEASFVRDWPVRFMQYLLLFLSVGFYEEMSSRVLINDAIVCQFRGRRSSFFFAAVISALIFGVLHILGTSFSSSIEVACAILKVVSAALVGTCFLLMFWRKENILGSMIIHTLFDFIPSIGNILFDENFSFGVTYVMDGDMGRMAIIVYCLEILWALCILFKIWKSEVSHVDFAALGRKYR